MARTEQLFEIADRLGYKVITIADLIAYRRRTERLITRAATTQLPTSEYGTVTVHAYESDIWTEPAVAEEPSATMVRRPVSWSALRAAGRLGWKVAFAASARQRTSSGGGNGAALAPEFSARKRKAAAAVRHRPG